MVSKTEELAWVEKYRPRRLEDILLPPRLKRPFESYIEKRRIPQSIARRRSGSRQDDHREGAGQDTQTRCHVHQLVP